MRSASIAAGVRQATMRSIMGSKKWVTTGILVVAVLLTTAVFFAASESYVVLLEAEIMASPKVLTDTDVEDQSTVVVDGVSLLVINTPIGFGTVNPGQEVREHLKVGLSSSFLADGTDGIVTYRIDVAPGPNDISPYIQIVRDESEGSEAADATSFATLSEPGDRSDLWWVIFTAPECSELAEPGQCTSTGIQLGAELSIVVFPPEGEGGP